MDKNSSVRNGIEEKIPLKQGLKLSASFQVLLEQPIEEKIPLKQGLKPKKGGGYRKFAIIEEKIPLKQGLKRFGLTLPNLVDMN